MTTMAKSDLSRRCAVFGSLAAVAVALSACGRRGPLEPPPGSAQARQRDEQADAAPEDPSGAAGLRRGSRRPPPPERPKRDFLLDPLL